MDRRCGRERSWDAEAALALSTAAKCGNKLDLSWFKTPFLASFLLFFPTFFVFLFLASFIFYSWLSLFLFLFSFTVFFLTFFVFLVLLVQASLFSITGFFTTSFVLTLNMQALFYFLGFLSSEVWEAGRCIETKLWRRISLISFMVFFKPEIGLPEQKRKCVGLQFFVAPFLALWPTTQHLQHVPLSGSYSVFIFLSCDKEVTTWKQLAVAQRHTWADCRTPGGRMQWWCGRGRGGGNAGTIFWPSPPVWCRASLLSPQAAWSANLS